MSDGQVNVPNIVLLFKNITLVDVVAVASLEPLITF